MSERRSITVDGVRLSYVTEGSGPSVVLIPAWMMDAQWWVDAGYVADLARSHRVIAVDPLGAGRSDGPLDPAAYTDDRLVEHLDAVLRAEQVTTCALWGYGNGASIAQLVARRRQGETSALVYGGSFLGADPLELAEEVHRENIELVAALESGDWESVWRILPPTPPDSRDRVMRDAEPRALAAVLRSGRGRAQGFMRSAVPTFAYWGTNSPYHQRNLDLAESMPIEFAVVPGDRYEAFSDAAAVLDVVRPFLAGVIAG